VAGGKIREAVAGDDQALARMRAELWPESSMEEHARELRTILAGEAGAAGVQVFVWESEGGTLTGFVETRLRSHADGCYESRPVGYLEGWFVTKDCRRQGIGAALVRAAEHWARGQSCQEMASDAEIANEVSQRAHEALGFTAVSRVVTYRKTL
jgi:aminoglycoside 6'-N-acetyltransferase I